MKIFAPINNVDETEALIKAGADELYCGVVPKEWDEKYSRMFSINRRHHYANQLKDFESLNKIIELAHKNDVQVYVTMNNLFYIEEQKDMILDFLKKIEGYKADGVIISSIPVIELCIKNTSIPVSVSGETLPINNQSVSLLKEMGVKRITFPRDITLNEISEIINKHPELEYEPFILRERCGFCGGNCFASHGIKKRNFCGENWNIEIISQNDDITDYRDYVNFKQTIMGYEIWRKKDYIPSIENKILDTRLSECGLCALKKMKELGVDSLKIVGRGIPTEHKISHIKLAKKAVEICNNTINHKDFINEIKQLKNAVGYCDSKMNCYYRDV